MISVDRRREGRPPRSGDTAGLSSPKHPRSRRRMTTRAHRRAADANAPARWAAEAEPSVLGYGASDTGAVVAFEDNVLSNCDFLIDGSTTGTNGTYVAGDPDFDVYAAGGLNAFVCNTTFLGFDQFSFWKSCMGSHADSQVVPDAKLAAGGSPRSGPPGHRLRQTRPPSPPGSPPPAPAPCASTSTARPAPPSGPGTPARTSVPGWRSPRSTRSRPRPARRRSR